MFDTNETVLSSLDCWELIILFFKFLVSHACVVRVSLLQHVHRGSIVLHFLALLLFANILLTYLPPIIHAVSEIRVTIARLDVYLNLLDDIFGHNTRTAEGREQALATLGNVTQALAKFRNAG